MRANRVRSAARYVTIQYPPIPACQWTAQQCADVALQLLQAARGLFVEVNAKKTAARVRAAIVSAKCVRRHLRNWDGAR